MAKRSKNAISTIQFDRYQAKLGRKLLRYWQAYVLLLPAFVVVLLFRYYPMYGIQLAFKSMKLGQTFAQAKWVGWKNFDRFFSSGMFARTLGNTLKVGLASTLTFPLPIILAVLLHNCIRPRLKNFTQSVTYIPYLLSTVVVVSILLLFTSESYGFIDIILTRLGLDPIPFQSKDRFVLPMYVISGIWSSLGYSAVIYTAALAGVNPEIVEASKVDGCSKLMRIWHVDLPTIRPTIIILLIMSIGSFMNSNTEKMLLMQTPLNLGASETIGTFAYELGWHDRQYGYSTAVDLFSNIVNFSLLLLSNFIASRTSGTSLF